MSNTTSLGGFKHIGYLGGYAPDFQLQSGTVGSGNATAIFRGDPVVFSSGLIIQAATGTSAVHGIFDQCSYIAANGQTVWSPTCPASTTATCYMISAPGAQFLVQSNGTAFSASNVNKNAGFALSYSGSTATGFSGATLDAANVSTANSYPFRIVAQGTLLLAPGTNGSDNSSNYNYAVVTFNSADFRAGTTGV